MKQLVFTIMFLTLLAPVGEVLAWDFADDGAGVQNVVSYPQNPTHNAPSIIINELMPNPSGADTGNEWFELWNYGDESTLLENWYVEAESAAGTIRTFKFPMLEIDANEYIILANDDIFDGDVDFVLMIDDTLSFFNSESIVRLLDEDNEIVDELEYFATSSGISLERQGYVFDDEFCLELQDHSENHTAGLPNENSNESCISEANLPNYQIVFSTDQQTWSPEFVGELPVSLHFALVDEDGFEVEVEQWVLSNIPVKSPHMFSQEYSGFISAEIILDSKPMVFESALLDISTEPTIAITEVYPSPQEGENEWIELFNYGDFPINLNNWYFRDAGSEPDGFGANISAISEIVIEPGEYIVRVLPR